MKKPVTLSISDEIFTQTKAYTESKGVGMSELVEDLLLDFLAIVLGKTRLETKYGLPSALTVPTQPPLETLIEDTAQAIAGKRGPGGRKPSRMTGGKKAATSE